MAQQTKIMTDEWKSMQPSQKQKYEKMAADDKKRYENEKSQTPNNSAALMLFAKQVRQKIEKEDPKLTEAQIMAKVHEKWTNAT